MILGRLVGERMVAAGGGVILNIGWDQADRGYMLPPGNYSVAMHRYDNGKLTPLGTVRTLVCEPLNLAKIPAADQAALRAFTETAPHNQVRAFSVLGGRADGVVVRLHRAVRVAGKVMLPGTPRSNTTRSIVVMGASACTRPGSGAGRLDTTAQLDCWCTGTH